MVLEVGIPGLTKWLVSRNQVTQFPKLARKQTDDQITSPGASIENRQRLNEGNPMLHDWVNFLGGIQARIMTRNLVSC